MPPLRAAELRLLALPGIAARVRCGFATYFQPGQGLDHWITEYQDGDGRWVRIDSEILGGTVLDHAENLRPGEFLSGGEAWAAFRRGEIDAARFGVYGTGNWGPAEIRGNAVKDLAALNKVEIESLLHSAATWFDIEADGGRRLAPVRYPPRVETKSMSTSRPLK